MGAVSARLHPAKDPKYAGIKWTVYRGVAYDITDFIPRHPGGSWLANLAVGRDCTALVESYHLRQEMTRSLFQKLPILKGFPVDMVPRAPYPNDSKLYVDIRERVRDEVFGGKENKGYHRRGSEHAAVAVLSFAVATYCIYAYMPCFWTGMLLGEWTCVQQLGAAAPSTILLCSGPTPLAPDAVCWCLPLPIAAPC